MILATSSLTGSQVGILLSMARLNYARPCMYGARRSRLRVVNVFFSLDSLLWPISLPSLHDTWPHLHRQTQISFDSTFEVEGAALFMTAPAEVSTAEEH